MARLNTRSVKSRQNSVLRYIASTDIDKTASDLNVSTKQLQRFVRAKPETIRKRPEQYNKLLSADAKQVARENDVKLVQRLSGKRLKKAYGTQNPSPRLNRSIRLAKATREKYAVQENGKTIYRPVSPTKIKTQREQILTNMAGYRQKNIIDLYNSGDISESEAKQLMRKLYRNSGLSQSQADQSFEKATE